MDWQEVFDRSELTPYPFQIEAAKAISDGESVVICAPCGSGKTEAVAVPFLARRGKALPPQLVYSLPTRALVEDTVRRLGELVKKVEPNVEVKAHHGQKAEDKFFQSTATITTLDQTVGAYCATPLSTPARYGNITAGAVCSSLLCFDEVHTYDHELGFQTMLTLQQNFRCMHVPLVFMSATLPQSFLDYCQSLGMQIVTAQEETIPNRRNRRVTAYIEKDQLTPDAVISYQQGGNRVLIVCNTVKKAQEIFRVLDERSSKIFLIHSRFLAEDRENRTKDLVEAFKQQSGAVVISTQVCEVGLDISCDILLSELAPADALVQRMGRCARRGTKGEVHIFQVNSPRPYEEHLVASTLRRVRKLDHSLVTWDDERRLCDEVLGNYFHGLLNDYESRALILSDIVRAAFYQNRNSVERMVREISSCEVSIHHDPYALSKKIFQLPTLSVDARVLRTFFRRNHPYMVYVYSRPHGDEPDEDEFLTTRISKDEEIAPHRSGIYVIHPDHASYKQSIGLVLGEKGDSFSLPSVEIRSALREPFVYRREAWVEHALNCCKSFKAICDLYSQVLVSLAESWKVPRDTFLAILSVATILHDIGKLDKSWQTVAGGSDETPIAHLEKRDSTPFPPHAPQSATALHPVIEQVASPVLARYIGLAVAHHHQTGATEIRGYSLIKNWRKHVEMVLPQMHFWQVLAEKFNVNEVRSSLIGPGRLDPKLPEITNARGYHTYNIVSRIIRLSDWRSHHVDSLC